MRICAIMMMALALISCDRQGALQPLEVPAAKKLRFDPIAQLLTNRPTHVGVDRIGNVYWSQETGDGQDALFVCGADNLPRTTRLTSVNIFNAMGVLPAAVWSPARQSRGAAATQPVQPAGQIQSIAVAPDGALYFYFSGGAGAIGREAFGRFFPQTGEIKILADTQQLGDATGMGRSLDLARGELIVCGSIVRLFIRNSDAWILLDYDPRRAGERGAHSLVRTIAAVRIGEESVDLSRQQYALFAGPAGVIPDAEEAALLLRDLKLGTLYRVDSAGAAKPLTSLVDLPSALSDPAIDPPSKSILMFAADSSPIDPQVYPRPAPADLQTQYPALLSLSWPGGKFSAIGRDAIRGPGNFTVYSLRVAQLVPLAPATFVGYDAASGQLLRMRLTEQ